MVLIVTVNYDVSGFDHDGYCSGCEADGDIAEEWTYEEDMEVEDNFFDGYDILFNNNVENELNNYLIQNLYDIIVDYLFDENKILDKFNKKNDGCTSGGSGYCNGYYQDYFCRSISWTDSDNNNYKIERSE